MARTCAARKKSGEPCASQVLADGTHCYMHAPGIDQQRTEARAKGGRSRANYQRVRRLMPDSLSEVYGQLEVALADVLADRLDPKPAHAAAALARAMCSVLQVGEMEARLRRLEESA